MLINERLRQGGTRFSTKEPTITTLQHWIGRKGDNKNIKADFLVFTLGFVQDCSRLRGPNNKTTFKKFIKEAIQNIKYEGAGGSDICLPTTISYCIHQKKLWIYNFFLFPRTIFLHITLVLLLKIISQTKNKLCLLAFLQFTPALFYFIFFNFRGNFFDRNFAKNKKILVSWTPPFTIIIEFH